MRLFNLCSTSGEVLDRLFDRHKSEVLEILEKLLVVNTLVPYPIFSDTNGWTAIAVVVADENRVDRFGIDLAFQLLIYNEQVYLFWILFCFQNKFLDHLG